MSAFASLLSTAGAALLLSVFFASDSTLSAQEVKNLTELVVLDDRSALGELKYWNSVKESNDPELVKSYLENFPDGMFTDPALARYQQLSGTPLDGKLPAAGIVTETGTEQVVKPKSKPVVASQVKKSKKVVNATKKKSVAKKKTKSVVAAAPQKAKVASKKKAVKSKSAAKTKQCSVQTADGSPCPTKVVAKPVKKKRIETGGGGGGGGGGWGG